MTRNSILLLSLLQGVACSAGVSSPQAGGPISPDLPPCPSSPNCVSSQAKDRGHRVEPLAFAGDPAEAMRRLREVVEDMPRTRIVFAGNGVLRAEFTSRLFRFIDDVEARLDAARQMIDIRSASRTGYWDLGANRRRVEEIRKAFARSAPKDA